MVNPFGLGDRRNRHGGVELCRRLLDEGARVVGLIADDDPTSELARSGTLSEMVVMSGRLERYDDVERAVNNTEVDTVIHLGSAADCWSCCSGTPPHL